MLKKALFLGLPVLYAETKDGGLAFAVTPFCEEIGIDPKNQLKKLNDPAWAARGDITVRESRDARPRPMGMVHSSSFFSWVMGINIQKVNASAAEVLIQFRETGGKWLDDLVRHGAAYNQNFGDPTAPAWFCCRGPLRSPPDVGALEVRQTHNLHPDGLPKVGHPLPWAEGKVMQIITFASRRDSGAQLLLARSPRAVRAVGMGTGLSSQPSVTPSASRPSARRTNCSSVRGRKVKWSRSPLYVRTALKGSDRSPGTSTPASSGCGSRTSRRTRPWSPWAVELTLEATSATYSDSGFFARETSANAAWARSTGQVDRAFVGER